MGVKVTNNAFGTLSASINNTDTTVTLDSGQGARFPTLGASDYFYGTVIDTSNNLEIVKVTARSTDSMTVTRAQDNTTARAFAIGDRFELRPTAALFEDISDSAQVVNDTTPQLGGDLDTNGNIIKVRGGDGIKFYGDASTLDDTKEVARFYGVDATATRYGLTTQQALVVVNQQGSTNQAFILNDSGNTSDQYTFAVCHNQDITADGTSATADTDGTETGWDILFGIGAQGDLRLPKNPMFCAYRSDTGTDNEYPLSGNEGTVGACANSTTVNIGSCFNTTNNRFTAPLAGHYQFNFNLSLYVISGTGGDNSVGWGLYKNGSRLNWNTYDSGLSITQSTPFVIGQDTTSTITHTTEIGAPHYSSIVTLAANDYIEVGWRNMSNNLGIRSFIFSGRKVG